MEAKKIYKAFEKRFGLIKWLTEDGQVAEKDNRHDESNRYNMK